MNRPLIALVLAASTLSVFAFAGGAAAQSIIPDTRPGGKLLLTGGVSTLEGAGGGGLSTWATITGYGEEDGIGGNAHVTVVALPDYELRTAGVAVGLWDRVELSAARQQFDTGDAGAALGLGQGFTFTQDVIGVKLRLSGDAVYDQDAWLPQIAIGAQHKMNDQGAVIAAIGGRDDQGMSPPRNCSWRKACWSAARCVGPTPTRPDFWASAATSVTIARPSSRARWDGC
jgi:hypothetical protein